MKIGLPRGQSTLGLLSEREKKALYSLIAPLHLSSINCRMLSIAIHNVVVHCTHLKFIGSRCDFLLDLHDRNYSELWINDANVYSFLIPRE